MSQTLLFPDPRPIVERLGRDFFLTLPERPGVYLMRDARDTVLYVGKAKNLRRRLGSYRIANPDRLGRRHLRLLHAVERIELQECSDEAAALAREADLLREIKPKFNRAGTWPGKPRYLAWRVFGDNLEMIITEIPEEGWQIFGPGGSGLIYLRHAVARLLWLAARPEAGFSGLPCGWSTGKFPVSIILPGEEIIEAMQTLFAGDTETFVQWHQEKTKNAVNLFDAAAIQPDIEYVTDMLAP